MSKRGLRGCGGAVFAPVALIVLSSCSSPAPAESLVNESVHTVNKRVSGLTVYDISKPELNIPPLYDQVESDGREWIVVAACSPTGKIDSDMSIAVLPKSRVTVSIRRQAERHELDWYVASCPKKPDSAGDR